MDSAIRRQTLADLLRRSAKRFPNKTAIVCSATRWSFAEFDEAAEEEVIAHCAQHLAGFKAPKAVVFADALPRNPSGKLLERELRQRHQSRFTEA